MKRSLRLMVSTAGLLLLAGAPAWASPSPTPDVQWTYNFNPGKPFVSADSPGTGTVTFTNEPIKSATNSSDVVVTNLRVSSTAPSDTPDMLSKNGAWSSSLVLTDTASNASQTFLFSGKLGGSFSASNANVSNTFTGTTTYNWTAPDGNKYTVTLTAYTPPGPPTASNAGSISAHVSVTPNSGGGVIGGGTTPEPSTLVLSCLGLAFAGATSWRKRRALVAQA